MSEIGRARPGRGTGCKMGKGILQEVKMRRNMDSMRRTDRLLLTSSGNRTGGKGRGGGARCHTMARAEGLVLSF